MAKYIIRWKQTIEQSMVVKADSEEEARAVFEDIYYDPESEVTFHSIEIKEN
jgi:hypothetical protein